MNSLLARDLIALVILLFLIWQAAGTGDAWFGPFERWLGALARKKTLTVFVVGASAVLFRLALLPWIGVPTPSVHDEFSYLLAADTFVHGRLANPTHPLWTFFDSFHVLQHPTYSSMYSPAQGAVLGIGQLLGQPWVGVLLANAAMCMAMTWMLQGWAPPEWALLGGALVLGRFAVFSYWMNSYWGGSVSATGAALVMGALPRILRSGRARSAVICGVGAGILATSRPLEGFIFFLPVGIVIPWWCVRGGVGEVGARLRQVLLPLAAVLVVAVGFVGYYNWRVAGNALTFPEMIETRAYVTSPVFVWQGEKPQHTYANAEFEEFYDNDVAGQLVPARLKLSRYWRFFLGPGLTVALLAVPWLLGKRLVRLLLVQFVLSSLGLLAVTFFFPHYAAPLLATLVLLVTLGFQRIWQSGFRLLGRPVGVGVVRVAVLYSVLIGPAYLARTMVSQSNLLSVRTRLLVHAWYYPAMLILACGTLAFAAIAGSLAKSPGSQRKTISLLQCGCWLAGVLMILGWQSRRDDYVFTAHQPHDPFRQPIEQQLDSVPGEHLVLVRYGECHDAGEEYVYNGADIDHSRIVWARDDPGENIDPLLDYFRNRDVWVFEPDNDEKLYRYSPESRDR